MPWIWYANRTLGRHLVMPGDCCSHWLGFASRIPLKWQHLFTPFIHLFSHSLFRSLFLAQKDALLVMAVITWRCWGVEEKSVADHFPFLWGAKTWRRFIFHSGLHDFRTLSHKRLRRKKMSENGSCLCATEKGNCLYHSQTTERQMLLSGNSCATFHTAICRRVHAEGECVERTLKKGK